MNDAQRHARRSSLQSAFLNPDSTAITLVVAAAELIGSEGFKWAPETILAEFRSDIGVEPTAGNFAKMMGGIALVSTDRFYRSVPDFIDLANALSGVEPDATSFDPADAMECAWAVAVAALLNPPDHEDQAPFDPQVLGYIDARLDEEGMVGAPRSLAVANRSEKAGKIMGDFSDDPEMFSAVSSLAADKADEIDKEVIARLGATATQLAALTLESGDTRPLVDQIRRYLNQQQTPSPS